MAKKKQSKVNKSIKDSFEKKAPVAPQPQARGGGVNITVPEDKKDDVLFRLLDSKLEIPLGLLRQTHIFLATPCYGGQIGEPFFRSMLKLAILFNKYDIKFTVSTLANESLVTRGRNTLVSFFMENPQATHLFFIDADIEFNPEDILRMVAYDKDVVVGAYPKKAVNWDSIIRAARNPDLDETAETIEGHSSNYVVNFEFLTNDKGEKIPQVQIEDNLVKLKDAGTGFMCIKKHVIQKMFDKHPELKYVNDINVDMKFEPFMYALFDTMIDPESRRYLSEDYTFCRLWQNMGGTIYLDPRTALNHVGHYTFRGNIRKLFTGQNNHRRTPDVGPASQGKPTKELPKAQKKDSEEKDG